MMTAIPAVKPVITGVGMKRMMPPNLTSPIASRIRPAIRVATCSPSMPYWAVMPARMTMKAPVGPLIDTRELPNRAAKIPATMPV